MAPKIKAFAAADTDAGIIVLPTISWTAKEARARFVETEREYLLWEENEEKDDKSIWRRAQRQGWKIIPIELAPR